MVILLVISLITLTLLGFIHKTILKPFLIQSSMQSQGIKGPSYKIIHGTTKESMRLNIEAPKNPVDLSHHDIFPILQPSYYTWLKIYGNNVLTWNGTQPHVIITEPELVKEIMTNKEGLLQKLKPDVHIKKLFGDGLAMTEGQKWAKLRKLATHAFYAESLKEMVPAMVASAESMLENWRQYEGKEIEISKEFLLLSSEVISRTAFGSSYVDGKNIFDMISKLMMIMFMNAHKKTRSFSLNILKSNKDDEANKMDKSLRDSVMAIVRKREQKVLTGETESFGVDFLGLLLRAHHDPDEKNRISFDNIIDECKTFFLAGHDTTSALLSWTGFLLAIHTDWQDKARNEVLEVFGNDNPTAEGLPKLKIVNMIINEVLRLYSPAPRLIRRARRKVRLGKYEFPANMQFEVPALALHRNPQIWGQDSHLFKPERFDQGVALATGNNPTAYVPFGFGPRKCVGLNFASNEARVAFSMILQRYKFTLSKNYVHAPVMRIAIHPELGVPVMLEAL